MSKFACECGTLISNVESSHDSLVISEAGFEDVLAQLGAKLALFIRLDASDRAQWLKENFSEDYPPDGSDEEVIEDFITKHVTERSRFMITCPSCGRLHLQQRPQATEYHSFAPATPSSEEAV